MGLLISPAYADGTAGAAPAPGGGYELVMIVIMMVVFYLFLIRPQSKRAKEHRDLIGALAKGDEVVTTGGLLGKVTKVTDDFVVVEIANNLEVKVQKSAVHATLPKGTIKSI